MAFGFGISPGLVVSFVVMASASPCAAQSWPLVFEPGQEWFTPEQHRLADDVAAAVAALPPDRAAIMRLELEGAGPADGRAVWRLRATALELAQRGLLIDQVIGADRVFSEETPQAAAADTGSRIRIIAEVDPLNPSRIVDRFGPTVRFGRGSVTISPEGRFLIARQVVGPHLKTVRARVEGHADTEGDAASNLRLSQARADAVARELVRIGMPFEHVRTSAYGESALAVPSQDGVAESGNRRVTVRLNWPAADAR